MSTILDSYKYNVCVPLYTTCTLTSLNGDFTDSAVWLSGESSSSMTYTPRLARCLMSGQNEVEETGSSGARDRSEL